MSASIFSLTGRANPNLVAERIRRQQWRYNPFGKWIGRDFLSKAGYSEEFVKQVAPGMEAMFTGAPIEVHKDFMKAGKTTLDIPVSMRLTSRPVYGDKPLKGTAEAQRVLYRTVRINITRKGYSPPTLMSAQVVLPWLEQEMFKAEQRLTSYYNDYWPGNFITALCTGYSLDLLAPTAEGGRGMSIMSHPNFIVAGSGAVAYTGGKPGSAGYEAAVESALDGLTDTASDYMSVSFIENLVIEAQRRRIAPIVMEGGYQFYAVWISDAQWKQLTRDDEFRDVMKRLDPTLAKSPLATGAKASIGGAVIYVDMSLFGARTNADDANVTAGTVEYGPAPTTAERALGFKIGNCIENLDTANKKIGFIVGQNALAIGQGVPVLANKKQPTIAMTELIDDHGAVVEIGMSTVQSAVRTDAFDHDGMVSGNTAGDFQESTGSLAFATYSPHTLKYS